MVAQMKIFHIADLHLGKRVNEFLMIEDQAYILEEIIKIIKKERPDALILAGDIYDRSIPSNESVRLFDYFLHQLKDLNLKVYIIAGNHDSKERLAFASSILRQQNFFIEADYHGEIFVDKNETVDIYLLPFIKPIDVRKHFEHEISSYDQAFENVLGKLEVDTNKFNILVAHQFVTHQTIEPELSDSESINIGGLDNIDTSHFKDFDYVALGHIHRPQRIGRDTIRYAGSILKYSQSEVHHTKSICVLDIEGKNLEISTIPLIPKRDMVHIEGYLEDLLKHEGSDDFVYATLFDEDEKVDALGRLREKYPNLLNLSFKNQRLEFDNQDLLSYEALDKMNPLDLFKSFYERQNNQALTKSQETFVKKVMEDIDETH